MLRRSGGTPVIDRPATRISPDVGSSKPAIILRIVLLPQPDGPSSEKNSPRSTTRSTPLTALTVPNSLRTPRSSICGGVIVGFKLALLCIAPLVPHEGHIAPADQHRCDDRHDGHAEYDR